MVGYIYKITNTINDKVYIGQTVKTLDERWQNHCYDSRTGNAKIYRAMQKHGLDNFSIHLIEECDKDNLDNREIYWIETYHSYSAGYNSTLGGRGNCLYEYDAVAQYLLDGNTIQETRDHFNCCRDLVINVKEKYGIPSDSSRTRVDRCDLSGKILETHRSTHEAGRWLEQNKGIAFGNARTSIGKVCKGKGKTAYGFKWKYAD